MLVCTWTTSTEHGAVRWWSINRCPRERDLPFQLSPCNPSVDPETLSISPWRNLFPDLRFKYRIVRKTSHFSDLVHCKWWLRPLVMSEGQNAIWSWGMQLSRQSKFHKLPALWTPKSQISAYHFTLAPVSLQLTTSKSPISCWIGSPLCFIKVSIDHSPAHECKDNPMTCQLAGHHFGVGNVMETPYLKPLVSRDAGIVAQHRQWETHQVHYHPQHKSRAHTQPSILQPAIVEEESQPYKYLFEEAHILWQSDHTIENHCQLWSVMKGTSKKG